VSVTHTDVLISFGNAQRAARALGLPEMEYHSGSGTMGIQHAISGGTFIGQQAIGKTRAEAILFLDGMTFAWEQMRRAKASWEAQRRMAALTAPTPQPTENAKDRLRHGLCTDRSDHQPHEVNSAVFGWFWCHADQTKREPYASEQRRKGVSS
jgi:hypothetical protein